MKFNTKNLWTGYLLRSFLFVFLLLGVLSFGIPKAQADIISPYVVATTSVSVLSGSGAEITTVGCPSGQDGVLLLISSNYQATVQSASFSGDAFVNYLTESIHPYNSWRYIDVVYLLDYDIGENLPYIINTNYGNIGNHAFVEVCGIDKENVFEKYYYENQGPYSGPYFISATSSQDSFFSVNVSFARYSGYTLPSDNNFSLNYDYSLDISFYQNDDSDIEFYHYVAAVDNIYGAALDIIFNNSEFTPPPNDYILYYGDNPKYVKTTEVSEYPVVYNICDSWSSTSTYYAELYYDVGEGVVLADEVLSTCSGTIELSSSPFGYEFTNGVNVRILDYTNSVVITESDPFLLAVYSAVSDSDNWIKFAFDNPYYIPVNSATTTLDFTYRIYYEDIASSTLCFKNILNNAKTSYCSSSLVEGLATTSIDVLPSPNELFVSLQAVLYDVNNNEILSSNPFMLAYYSATSSGSVAGDLEDMNSAFCLNFESGFVRDVCNGVTFWTSGIMDFITRTLKSFFPISLMTDVFTAWRSSAGGVMPEEMDFLPSANSNNDLEIELPSSWVGSASSSFVIWGNSFFKDIPKMSFFFAGVRYITTILLWVGLIFYFIVLGKKTLSIIKE